MSRPAIFFDRDGTLTREVGYLDHPDRLVLLPRSAAAVRLANEAGAAAVLVTNQSGIARGRLTEAVLSAIHERLVGWLGSAGARLDAIYWCPHHPSEGRGELSVRCECRKPSPGMLHRAAAEHDLDLGASLMVGDSAADLGAGSAAGTRTALVGTGYGPGVLDHQVKAGRGPSPDHVATDAYAAVRWWLDGGRRAVARY